MEQTVIRPMEEGDLAQVCRIEEETFSDPWSESGFADSLKLPYTLFLVAETAGQIIGYCGCYQSFNEAEIVNVAVEKMHRGQGTAEKMLQSLLDLSVGRGVDTFFLEVRMSNQPARRLYEKLGFQLMGIRKNFYEKPAEDAVVMKKNVNA